jgi:hypothetical protein
MSALHPLMKFPLHGDEMVVLSEAVAHSPHMVDELEDTPTGLKPDSCDPPNYHSWHEPAILGQGQHRAKLVLAVDM